MPIRWYDEKTKARAVRLVRDHCKDSDSEWAAIKAISARLGMTAETLRKWVRQAEIDAGEAAGVSSEDKRELRELRRKNHELELTIEILKAAWGFPAGKTFGDWDEAASSITRPTQDALIAVKKVLTAEVRHCFQELVVT